MRKYPAVPVPLATALAIADTVSTPADVVPNCEALPVKVTSSEPVSAVAQVAGTVPVKILILPLAPTLVTMSSIAAVR